MNVTLDIAGLLIDFDTRFPDYVKRRCAEYLSDRPSLDCNLHFAVPENEIARSDSEHVGPMEAELFAMTIPFSEHLPQLGRLMTHGVAIAFEGRSYIFTAESGTGKSTHAFLWQRHFGEDKVRIINGDKPILWFKEDGTICSCGSPWSGKEGLSENVCLPLGGICLLERLENHPELCKPEIRRAGQGESLDFLMHQIFIPKSLEGKMQTFRLLDRLYDGIPVYRLVADMSRESVIISSSTLSSGDAGARKG